MFELFLSGEMELRIFRKTSCFFRYSSSIESRSKLRLKLALETWFPFLSINTLQHFSAQFIISDHELPFNNIEHHWTTWSTSNTHGICYSWIIWTNLWSTSQREYTWLV